MNQSRNLKSMFVRSGIIGTVLLVFVAIAFFGKFGIPGWGVEARPNLTPGKLAFATTVGTISGPQLYIRTANPDGSNVVTIAGSLPPVNEPVWSPDGTKIAFVASVVGQDIYVMNADGSNLLNLTNTNGINETNPSWSVNGTIAYERAGQVWTMNSDGTGQAQFTAITQPSPASPAWSADGSKLAFVSGGEIWKINADGAGEQRLTNNVSTDTNPAWSPDGSKIVFGKGGSGIAVVTADGISESNLTTVAGDANPAWSSDGTTIAFRRDATPAGIHLMDASGGNQVKVVGDVPGTTGSSNNNPAWQPVAQTAGTFTISGRINRGGSSLTGVTVNLSGTVNATATTDGAGNYWFSALPAGGSYTVSPSFPNHHFDPPNRSFGNLDSNRIADFAAFGTCTGLNCAENGKIAFFRGTEIYSVNSDGSNLTNLTNSATTDTDPDFSPDGSKIIFSTNRDGNNEIYQMNNDGSNPIRLTNNAASDSKPRYSPNGSSIVFVSNRDGNTEIYKMDADGGNQLRLTNDAGTDDVPSFSPDGQKIIFVTSRLTGLRLFTMNADGSNQSVISDVAGYYNRPSYSRDGSKILFVYGNDVTTQNIWTMNADGTNRVQSGFGRSSPSYSPDGTQVAHACCFTPTSSTGIYVSNVGGGLGTQISVGIADDLPVWQPIATRRRVHYDFDGDGRSDISVYRPSDGNWYLLRSSAGFTGPHWGIATDIPVPADYDGDLITDVAVWRPSEGNYYVLNSFDGTVRVENFGLSGDIPMAADWDADGKADLSVYRGGAQSYFYYRGSNGNPNSNITFLPWGLSGDTPVAADYDGDGRTDAAVFRPSERIWYVRRSSDGQLWANTYGLASDVLVPADYDGDGKTDLAVYRSGIWYVLGSLSGFYAFQYGLAADIPTPADYDGDGKSDAAVYRNGVWYVLKSGSASTDITNFGLSGDNPLPSSTVRF